MSTESNDGILEVDSSGLSPKGPVSPRTPAAQKMVAKTIKEVLQQVNLDNLLVQGHSWYFCNY